MRLDVNKLSSAIRLSLTLGAVAAAGTLTAQAQTATGDQQKNQSLETIVVTGSNIRRVDVETANPVLTIDHATIEKSGKLTVGDLVQALPSMAGSATNPNVNNGGGSGASTIGLRGLGSARSLMLINGHRVPLQLQDLNIIPADAVERIEVLTDGSSAVYGSDAIAGVVNIITRSNYQGAEFGLEYGQSDRDDGERRATHFMFGHSTDKGSITIGLNYNKSDPVSAANRAYSHDALYRYNTGYVVHGGSSRTPVGAIYLPAGSAIRAQFGCGRLARKTGAPGTSLADFRCSGGADNFNYQAVGNYDTTPVERTGLFALGNYKLTDHVEVFAEVFHNKTVSQSQFAPVPLDAQQDALYIPADQYYNVFGIPFGVDPATGNVLSEFKTRLTTLGGRQTNFGTTHDLLTAGFKGAIGDTTWNWFADAQYGKITSHTSNADYINYTKLAANFACTTLACDPINIFNIDDPHTIEQLQSAKTTYNNSFDYQMKMGEVGVSGSLFDLPAGSVQLAAGASYRKEYVNSVSDQALVSNVVSNNGNYIVSCSGPGSLCGANTQGGFNVKEAYAELLVPVLKDLPFVHSLNVDLGTRYSKYSNFGSTNNWKAAIEYRPIQDLLLRGTVSKVFRAPTVSDLFLGPTADSPTATDPCGPASVASNPACQGYTFPHTATSQTNGIVMGSNVGNSLFGTSVNLQPEHGKSFDYGFVYDPTWLPGLSVSADYYRVVLNNLIVSGAGTAQTILNACFAGATDLCSLIKRIGSGPSIGNISYIFETSFNSGQLTTSGADVSAHYRLPETAIGNFGVNFSATYIGKYDITQVGERQGYAGHFDRTYGHLSRWHALAGVDWNWGAFNANWTGRYIGRTTIGYACLPGSSAAAGDVAGPDGCYPNPEFAVYHYGAYVYHDVSFGYDIAPLNTTIQIGVNNIADRTPPIFYQQNVANANTDVATYDPVGRFYFAKATIKF
jgi:outer membrane receptor protein involved in Fe transport